MRRACCAMPTFCGSRDSKLEPKTKCLNFGQKTKHLDASICKSFLKIFLNHPRLRIAEPFDNNCMLSANDWPARNAYYSKSIFWAKKQ